MVLFAFYMSLIPYQKPHATSTQRIAHLKSKGLIIPRPTVAARKIELIGYERLRIYFLSRRDQNSSLRPFIEGTSYRDIIDLYECDVSLRAKCFDAVGEFELLLRNAISEALSNAHGSHPYTKLAAFKDEASRLEVYKIFVDIYYKTKDQRAKHYRQKYATPVLPPIWTMKEFMTFGTTLLVLKHLAGPIRTDIANSFGVPKDEIFTNWVNCLVDLRNICAHHDRLFNRSFPKQPSRLSIKHPAGSVPTAPEKKLKAILECLEYMLNKRGSKTKVVSEVGAVVKRYSAVKPSEVGY